MTKGVKRKVTFAEKNRDRTILFKDQLPAGRGLTLRKAIKLNKKLYHAYRLIDEAKEIIDESWPELKHIHPDFDIDAIRKNPKYGEPGYDDLEWVTRIGESQEEVTDHDEDLGDETHTLEVYRPQHKVDYLHDELGNATSELSTAIGTLKDVMRVIADKEGFYLDEEKHVWMPKESKK